MFRGLFSKLSTSTFALALVLLCLVRNAQAGQPLRWNSPVNDIHGQPVTIDTFIDRVTVVSFSTQKSKESDMRLGQEIGERFGQQRVYQSLAIPNTADVPLWAKFLAVMKVVGAEKDAVKEAILRQKATGNGKITEEEVRRKIIFIHDKDGSVWERMGLDVNSTRSFIGVIDRTGTLIHLERMPVNKQAFFALLEREFRKQAAPQWPQ